MRTRAALAALGLVAALVAPAHAVNWSIGPNLGYSHVKPDYSGADATNVFAWPNGGYLTPGLRIGFKGESPVHEVYIDTDLTLTSTKGSSTRSFTARGNYQYNFTSSGSVEPFVTAGIGAVMAGAKVDGTSLSSGADLSGASAVFGGGVGLRHKMGNGHGICRGEVRFDRTTEAKSGGGPFIPKTNTIGVKLGVDLWDK